ncbi:MAG TPA: peptidase M42 [Ruminococcaceae bacterium]|nr:peptidase M42 [Oscillospiraceae bacterium]
MDITQTLFALSNAAGVTGVSSALDILEPIASRFGKPRRDNMGGLTVFMDYGTDKTVMLDAHIDEIGFVVTGVDEDGFVNVAKSGGVDIRTLPGQEVTVHAAEPLYGVFCCPVPHLSKNEKAMPPIEDMAVDIGFSPIESQARVRPGDRVSFRQSSVSLQNERITGKSFDNRAGAAVLLRAAELIKDGGAPGVNIALCFSAQEELGCRGAKTMAYELRPAEAVVVDVSFGDGAGVPESRCGKLDGGVMIGVAPTLYKPISNRMISLAFKHDISYQLEGMGGVTSTNADVISLTGAGIPCGLLSIPLRYMHTVVELISPGDVESAARLIFHYIKEWGRDE